MNEIAEKTQAEVGAETVFTILATVSFCHLLNDLVQSVTRLAYAVVMGVSILYQGGMARYFLKRRNDVATYLASPDWARSLALSMHRQN